MQQGKVTLEQLESDFLSYLSGVYGLRKNTLLSRRVGFRAIAQYFVTSDNLTLDNTRAFSSLLREKYATGTANLYITTLRYVYEFLIEKQIVSENYAQKVMLVKAKRNYDIDTLLPEEIEALLNVKVPYGKKAQHLSVVWYYAHSILAKTGLRAGELVSLQVKNLDFNNESIRISTSKNGEPRLVPIPSDLLQELKNYCKLSHPDAPLLVSSTGRAIHQRDISRDMKRRAELCGIKKRVYPHLYRHSFATIMLKEGCPLPVVQRILGHESVKTTEIYIHLELQSLADAMKKYHPLISRNMSAESKLEHLKEVIEATGILKDSRFKAKLSQSNNEIELRVRVK